MKLVRASVLGEGLEGDFVGEMIEEELASASNARSEARAGSSRGPEERREARDGFGNRDVHREAIASPGEHQSMQPPQRPRALVPVVDLVGPEAPAQPMVQRRPRFVDERRIEREELERPRRIAPHVAVNLPRLREPERSGCLHALAAVDARDRSTAAREAHAVVRLHAPIELRGLSNAEVGDAGTDRSRPGRR